MLLFWKQIWRRFARLWSITMARGQLAAAGCGSSDSMSMIGQSRPVVAATALDEFGKRTAQAFKFADLAVDFVDFFRRQTFNPDFPNELQFDDAHGRFCYKNQCIIIITPGEARVTRRVNPGPPIYGSISTVASSLNSMVPRLRQTLDCSPTGSLTMPLA